MKSRQVSPLVVGALLLAGCALQARPGSDPTAGEEQLKAFEGRGEQFQCDPGKEHWRAEGSPKRGAALKLAGGSPRLDVAGPAGRAAWHIGIYEYLVRPRACVWEDQSMAPELARSWEVSPDGRTWTLKLREDVRWHNLPPVNGRPFTSADVVWTMAYVKQGGQLKTYFEEVGVDAPDPHTVLFRLKEPRADFLDQLGDDANVMLPREVKDQLGDFKAAAIGTGTFMLKEFKPDQLTAAQRNPEYRETGKDGKALPYLDEVHSIGFPDPVAELAALRAGVLDYGNVALKPDADALRQTNPKLRAHYNVATAMIGLWLNPHQKPWDDVRVRKAVALAVDRDDVIVGANQGGAVYTGFIPPFYTGYAWSQETMRQRFKTDRERAKQLLAEAGYTPGGVPFVFRTSGSYVLGAEVVHKHLEAIGIPSTLSVEPTGASAPVIAKGDFDLAYGATRVGRLLGAWADLVATGSERNVARFSDRAIDTLVVAQEREMDPVKRKQVLDQMQDRLYEAMPYVPVITPIYFRFYSCQARNLSPVHNTLGFYGLKHAWLDSTGC